VLLAAVSGVRFEVDIEHLDFRKLASAIWSDCRNDSPMSPDRSLEPFAERRKYASCVPSKTVKLAANTQ
jgi:hypothetical protein